MRKQIFLMFLIGLFLIGLVNAGNINTPTVTTPAASGTLSGGGLVNISFAGNDGSNVTWCSFQVMSSSTANSSWSTVVNISNSSAADDSNNANWGDLNWTLTSDITAIIVEDSNDYSARAVCYNGSDNTTSATVTSVTIDRTKPQTPTTAHADETEFDDVTTKTITYTITGENTTSCRIAFLIDGAPPRFTGTNTFSMTHSGNSCTYTVTKATIADAVYDVYVRASDGTNTTNSARSNFGINTISDDAVGTADGFTVPVAKKVAREELMKNIFWVLAGGFVIWALFFRKTKK